MDLERILVANSNQIHKNPDLAMGEARTDITLNKALIFQFSKNHSQFTEH